MKEILQQRTRFSSDFHCKLVAKVPTYSFFTNTSVLTSMNDRKVPYLDFSSILIVTTCREMKYDMEWLKTQCMSLFQREYIRVHNRHSVDVTCLRLNVTETL